MTDSRLTVKRSQFPAFQPAVGDEVEVVVRGIVVRTEGRVEYHTGGAYLPTEIETEVLVSRVVEAKS